MFVKISKFKMETSEFVETYESRGGTEGFLVSKTDSCPSNCLIILLVVPKHT